MTITDRRYNQIFGLKEYKTPKCTVDTSKKPRNTLAGFEKAKIISYFEEVAQKSMSIPSSATYSKIKEWSKSKI